MNTALWTIQGILAGTFFLSGLLKMFAPISYLGKKLPWVPRHSAALVRFIGFSQFLAAFGFILPWYLWVIPSLTPLAGVGIAITMTFAIIEHIKRKEYPSLIVNFVFLGLSSLVAYIRFCELLQ